MKIKRGGEHHIATDHGPMVQEELLTGHPGSIHGEEETPGGQSSLRQGAGKRSSAAPDLGSAPAAEQMRVRGIGFLFWSFPMTGDIEAKGAARGGPGAPGAPLARPGVGPRQVAAWPPLGPSRAFLEASVMLIFYLNFPEFFWHFLYGGKLK